jgi:hypothetical protein
MNPLYQLCFVDHKTRWLACRCLVGVVFSYGVLMNVIFERPMLGVAIEDLIVAAAATIAFSLYYCYRSSARDAATLVNSIKEEKALANHPLLRVPRAVFVGAAIALLIVIPVGLATVGRFPPRSEAAWKLVDGLIRFRSLVTGAIPPKSAHAINVDVQRGIPGPGETKRYIAAPGERLFLLCIPDPHGCSPLTVTAGIERGNSSDMAFAEPIEGTGDRFAIGPISYVIAGEGTGAASRSSALSLDGWNMRNIVFRNLRISYKGGTTTLENLVFSRCTFDIEHNTRGAEFARALLRPGSTTFRAP